MDAHLIYDEAASGTAQTSVGHLRTTCPQEFGRIHVSPILTEFLDRHPGVVEGRRAAPKVRAFIDFAAERLRRTAVLSWKR